MVKTCLYTSPYTNKRTNARSPDWRSGRPASLRERGAGFRSFRRLAAHRVVLTVLLLAVFVSSTSCEAAERTAGALLGNFPGERGRLVIIVHRGFARVDWLFDKLDPLITSATTEGATVKVFMLEGGSAAGMIELPFSAAAGEGDFFPSGKNPDGWSDAAASFRTAALRDIVDALETFPGDESDTGADLLGALRHALRETATMPGDGARSVVMVSGGAVHRTETLDLVAEGVTPRSASRLAHRTRAIDGGDVPVELVGVGRFENLDPPVDPVFASGVLRFWQAVCIRCVIK